ncbi:hypothetical protein [Streptomyces sp. NPDC047123]|uniref:hypothetical protein n=1 Tax=unclassified Streptomyces TaxID=2593676 RepID=UPI0033DC1593
MNAQEVVGLYTIAGTGHGPYPGAATTEIGAFDSVALDHATVLQLAEDLNNDLHGFTATWQDDILCVTRSAEDQMQYAPARFAPDAHGRYRIGGLWPWADWGDWEDIHAPRTPKEAFALGVVEYCYTRATPVPAELVDAYLQGREAAHRVTRNQYAC